MSVLKKFVRKKLLIFDLSCQKIIRLIKIILLKNLSLFRVVNYQLPHCHYRYRLGTDLSVPGAD